MTDLEELLTPEEAARILRVSPTTLANWRYLGGDHTPEYSKLGKSIVYTRASLLDFVRNNARRGTAVSA